MSTKLLREAPSDPSTVIGFKDLLLLILAVATGILGATVLLPIWLPSLTGSLMGEDPKAYWYMARASGFVAYVLLWLSTLIGLWMTNKLATIWPNGPTSFDLHQYTGLLGLLLSVFHGLILMGDRDGGYSFLRVLVPFASVQYRPLWVGLGQIGLYLMFAIWLSYYLRRLIGYRLWRLTHHLSFLMFLAALLHSVVSGTDSASSVGQWLYWLSGGSFLFLTIHRLVRSRLSSQPSH